MKIKILYFAVLRERFGIGEEAVDIPHEAPTIATLLEFLRARGGVWRQCLEDSGMVKYAVNQEFAVAQTALTEGAEVALFPPVTGG